MIQQFVRSQGPVLGFKFSGRLHAADYDGFTPLVDQAIARYGRLRLLMLFEDMHGWDLGGFWRDLKFTAQHFTDVERFAVVGEARRDEWFAKLAKPFTTGEVRYFGVHALDSAWRWLEEDHPEPDEALLDPLEDPDPSGQTRPIILS